MAKKVQQQTEIEEVPVTNRIIPKREFHDLRTWATAEDDSFQLGQSVYWNGSGRYVDTAFFHEQLKGRVGVVVSARPCWMFGDYTDRVIRFEVGQQFVWVRANTKELEYA